MKFKVIFVKRKNLYYIIVSLLIIVLVFLYSITKPMQDIPTISVYNEGEVLKEDFDGDGEKELLYIRSVDGKYNLTLQSAPKNITIRGTEPNDIISEENNYWPLRVMLLDVNRDKLPEILLQGSSNGKPIQHIFAYNNGIYKDILSNSNNILGTIYTMSNKSPIVFTGNFLNGDIELNAKLLLLNNTKDISGEYLSSFQGKDTIAAFINYIQSFPDNLDILPKEIDSGSLTTSDYAVISKLHGISRTYAFEDGFFSDTKYNKDGNPSEIKWNLTFRGVSPLDSKDKESYTLEVVLKASDESDMYHYKLSSIVLK